MMPLQVVGWSPQRKLTAVTRRTYDDQDQLVDSVTTLYTYDELGRQSWSGPDHNATGELDLDGSGPAQRTEQVYETDGTNWFRVVRSLSIDDDGQVQTNQTTKTGTAAIDGKQVTTTIDRYGQTTTRTVEIDRQTGTVTTSGSSCCGTATETVTRHGLTLTQTDSHGTTLSFSYDGLGRRETITDPRTGTSTIHYDDSGRVAGTTDAASNTTWYAYDANGRLTAVTYDDATPGVTYVYDAFGRLISVTDAVGTRTFTYDAFGNQTSETIVGLDGSTNVITRAYDGHGRPSQVALNDEYQVGYSYNAASVLDGLTWSNATMKRTRSKNFC